MNTSILFPFDIDTTSNTSYFYALELARKIHIDLKVICTYKTTDLHRSFFQPTGWNLIKEKKKQIHLRLLELNGVYQGKHNHWSANKGTKVKVLLKEGDMINVLHSSLKQNVSKLVLCDYLMFYRVLLPSYSLDKYEAIKYKLWVMPKNIDRLVTKQEMERGTFEYNKKDIFGDLLGKTNFFSLPNDLHLLKSEYKEKSLH